MVALYYMDYVGIGLCVLRNLSECFLLFLYSKKLGWVAKNEEERVKCRNMSSYTIVGKECDLSELGMWYLGRYNEQEAKETCFCGDYTYRN